MMRPENADGNSDTDALAPNLPLSSDFRNLPSTVATDLDTGAELFSILRAIGGPEAVSSPSVRLASTEEQVARALDLVRSLPRQQLVSLRDADGHSAAHWAALSARDAPPVVKNAGTGIDSSGGSLVVLRALLAVAPTLAQTPSLAPVQAGQTPLHWAAVGGSTDAVRILLDEADADPCIRDCRGSTAAHHAVHYGHLSILHLLVRKAPACAEIQDDDGHTPLHWGAHIGSLGIVVYLLRAARVPPNPQDRNLATPLHLAAANNHETIVRAFLNFGADPYVRDMKDCTPIHVAEAGTYTRRTLTTFEQENPSPRSRQSMISRYLPERHAVARFLRKLHGYVHVIFFYVLGTISVDRYFRVILPLAPQSTLFNICIMGFLFLGAAACNASMCRDPGYVAKGSVTDFVEALDGAIDTGTFERTFSSTTYCFFCLAPRPPRSKHSRRPERCILRFDHHCPWVNADVGLLNHHPLLLYAIFIALAEWMFIYACVSVYRHSMAKYPSLIILMKAHPVIAVLMVVHFLVSIFAVVLLVNQSRLICSGFTTVEYMAFKKMAQPHNPYDMGFWQNIYAFLTLTGPGTQLPDAKATKWHRIRASFQPGTLASLPDDRMAFMDNCVHSHYNNI